jgi:hypothetical protein
VRVDGRRGARPRLLTMAGPTSLLRSVEVLVVEEPQRLYRVGHAREDERFDETFRSHDEQGLPPHGPEDRAVAIHMAALVFASADVAGQLASRLPKLVGHVATIDPALADRFSQSRPPQSCKMPAGSSRALKTLRCSAYC